MPGESTMICYRHDVTLGQLAVYIKQHGLKSVAEILEHTDFVCGDTCENCQEEGYNNDGISMAMAVGMVQRGYL